MVKTASGKRTTVRGSIESKRAVAHNRSVPSPGVSKARAIAIPSLPAGAKNKNSVGSVLSRGLKAGPKYRVQRVGRNGESREAGGQEEAGSVEGSGWPGVGRDWQEWQGRKFGRQASECNGSGCQCGPETQHEAGVEAGSRARREAGAGAGLGATHCQGDAGQGSARIFCIHGSIGCRPAAASRD